MDKNNWVFDAGYLSLWQQIAGPYLVVVPLSTVPNWIREFRKWLPQCNALVYVGDSKSREARPLPSVLVAPTCFLTHISRTWSCTAGMVSC